MKQSALKRKTPLPRISAKKKQEMEQEIEIRIALAERCGGEWVFTSSLTGGYYKGGICELCSKQPDWRGLHPHEYPFRSQGGKLSMDSKMLCGECHSKEHGIKEAKDEGKRCN